MVLVAPAKATLDYFKTLLIQLSDGFRTEINLEIKKNGY
jgi:hypothetical protein